MFEFNRAKGGQSVCLMYVLLLLDRAHVCTERRTYAYEATTYFAVRYFQSYIARCGLWNWWKCTRYR